jgi:hypothetical protein
MSNSLFPSSPLRAQPAVPGLGRRHVSDQEGPGGRMGCGLIRPPLTPETGYRVLVLILVFVVAVVRARYAVDAPGVPVTMILATGGYVIGATRAGRRSSPLPGVVF